MDEEQVPARRGRRPGDAAGERRADRDRARALRGVRARGFIGGITGAMLQAVRGHDRDRGRALGHRGADPHAGALRHAAQGHAARHTTTGSSGWFNRGSTGPRRATSARGRPGAAAGRGPGSPRSRCCSRSRSCSTAGCRAPSSRRKTRASSSSAIQLPDGASLQRTDEVVAAGRGDPAQGAGGRARSPALVGLNLLASRTRPTAPRSSSLLKPWDERGARTDSLDAILGRVNGQLFGLKDAIALRVQLPGDSRAWARPRDWSSICRPGAGRTSRPSPPGAGGSLADVNQLPETPGAATDLPRRGAAALRDRRPGDGQGARRRSWATSSPRCRRCCPRSTSTTSTSTAAPTACRRRRSRASGRRPSDIGRLYVRGADNGEMIPLSALTTAEFRGGAQRAHPLQRLHLRAGDRRRAGRA